MSRLRSFINDRKAASRAVVLTVSMSRQLSADLVMGVVWNGPPMKLLREWMALGQREMQTNRA